MQSWIDQTWLPRLLKRSDAWWGSFLCKESTEVEWYTRKYTVNVVRGSLVVSKVNSGACLHGMLRKNLISPYQVNMRHSSSSTLQWARCFWTTRTLADVHRLPTYSPAPCPTTIFDQFLCILLLLLLLLSSSSFKIFVRNVNVRPQRPNCNIWMAIDRGEKQC